MRFTLLYCFIFLSGSFLNTAHAMQNRLGTAPPQLQRIASRTSPPRTPPTVRGKTLPQPPTPSNQSARPVCHLCGSSFDDYDKLGQHFAEKHADNFSEIHFCTTGQCRDFANELELLRPHQNTAHRTVTQRGISFTEMPTSGDMPVSRGIIRRDWHFEQRASELFPRNVTDGTKHLFFGTPGATTKRGAASLPNENPRPAKTPRTTTTQSAVGDETPIAQSTQPTMTHLKWLQEQIDETTLGRPIVTGFLIEQYRKQTRKTIHMRNNFIHNRTTYYQHFVEWFKRIERSPLNAQLRNIREVYDLASSLKNSMGLTELSEFIRSKFQVPKREFEAVRLSMRLLLDKQRYSGKAVNALIEHKEALKELKAKLDAQKLATQQ